MLIQVARSFKIKEKWQRWGSREEFYDSCLACIFSGRVALLYPNFPKTTKKAPNSTVKGVHDIDATIRMRILEYYSTCAPEI